MTKDKSSDRKVGNEILALEAWEIAEKVQKKEIRTKEVAQAFLAQVQTHNPSLNALVTVNEKILARAEQLDSQSKSLGKLAGVPVTIKDMLCTKGIATTAASKMLKGYVPPYSATVVERLEQAGALVIGKGNQDEFAMGSSNESSVFGPCRNPWNKEYVPGGSSGGSAAAVAARLSPLAIGTDTGGSIRQPASFCGVVGIKPTYGRVSRYGIVAFASSLDQAGPMARSVRDAALTLEVIAGQDANDSPTSNQLVPNRSSLLNFVLRGARIGRVREFDSDKVHPEVQAATEKAYEILKARGAVVVDLSIPLIRFSVPIYYLVCTSEASSNLARYDGVRFGHRVAGTEGIQTLQDFYSKTRGEGFGVEVKRRIILGTFCLSSGYYDAYYRKAGQVRAVLKKEYDQAFSRCDILVSPVATTPAFKLGSRINDPLKMYLNDIFTTAANLVGIPGMSVPVAMTESGMPVGVQIQGPHFAEQKCLNAALAIEEAVNLKGRWPDGIG